MRMDEGIDEWVGVRYVGEHIGGCVGGWTDGQVDGWMVGGWWVVNEA